MAIADRVAADRAKSSTGDYLKAALVVAGVAALAAFVLQKR